MARSYRRVSDAVDHVRRALGALGAADGPHPQTYAFACGYAQNCLEQALEALDGQVPLPPSEAFVEGHDMVSSLEVELPFGEASDASE